MLCYTIETDNALGEEIVKVESFDLGMTLLFCRTKQPMAGGNRRPSVRCHGSCARCHGTQSCAPLRWS